MSIDIKTTDTATFKSIKEYGGIINNCGKEFMFKDNSQPSFIVRDRKGTELLKIGGLML